MNTSNLVKKKQKMTVTFFHKYWPGFAKKTNAPRPTEVVLKKVYTTKPTDSFANNKIKVVFFH